MEAIAKRHQLFAESRRRVMPMVEMDFDLAESAPAEVAQPIEDALVVFFLGVEKGVPGTAAIGIAERVDGGGISRQPILDRIPRGRRLGAIAERFIMVADAEYQVPGS